jgi:hypothetical protein
MNKVRQEVREGNLVHVFAHEPAKTTQSDMTARA